MRLVHDASQALRHEAPWWQAAPLSNERRGGGGIGGVRPGVRTVTARTSRRLLCCASACLLLASCAGGLRVESVESEHQKPNNVWLYLAVDRDGAPLDLRAEDFDIYEDDKLVPREQSK